MGLVADVGDNVTVGGGGPAKETRGLIAANATSATPAIIAAPMRPPRRRRALKKFSSLFLNFMSLPSG